MLPTYVNSILSMSNLSPFSPYFLRRHRRRAIFHTDDRRTTTVGLLGFSCVMASDFHSRFHRIPRAFISSDSRVLKIKDNCSCPTTRSTTLIIITARLYVIYVYNVYTAPMSYVLTRQPGTMTRRVSLHIIYFTPYGRFLFSFKSTFHVINIPQYFFFALRVLFPVSRYTTIYPP